MQHFGTTPPTGQGSNGYFVLNKAIFASESFVQKSSNFLIS